MISENHCVGRFGRSCHVRACLTRATTSHVASGGESVCLGDPARFWPSVPQRYVGDARSNFIARAGAWPHSPHGP
jgi:hypothetical protein